jgi:hypothetical protein
MIHPKNGLSVRSPEERIKRLETRVKELETVVGSLDLIIRRQAPFVGELMAFRDAVAAATEEP